MGELATVSQFVHEAASRTEKFKHQGLTYAVSIRSSFSSRDSLPHATFEPLIVAAVPAAGRPHGVAHVLLGALLARRGLLAQPCPPPAVDGVP